MRQIVLVGSLFALAACASGGASSTTSSTTSSTGSAASSAPTRAVRGSANRITEQEIAAGSYQTALDVIENLRPTMTRPRASSLTSSSGSSGVSEDRSASVNVVVYMDDIRLGDLASLRTIPAQQVREIRYISATEATTRWGTGHGSGAIQVIMKK
jgi:hypothetical protein